MTPDDAHRSPFSEDALRAIAKEKVLWKLGVQLDFLAFTFVNVLLVAIDLFLDPVNTWFPYPLSGWATGLAIHVAVYLLYSRGVIGTNRQGLILSTVIVVASSQSLFVINYFSDFRYQWFWWPVGALVSALLVYLVVYLFILRTRTGTDERKSWLDKKIDDELHKVQDRQGR